MRSRVTKDFPGLLAALPEHMQRQADDAYALFKQNPHHPSLHFKPINGRNTYYSARVGIHYRVLAYEGGGDIIWFWIDPHAAYDKLPTQISRGCI
jgi:hypothetical protein